ncbi:hypothetical protein SAMN05660284_00023 [Formivibrio citricus]|uniref:Uncharacterized protein n=1 Tax=Formivibrio citricus TaxID=83765 RepID=A0A1I4UXA4_9NEIS|nr:hypothetical protein [Formivibrio citricus]SFM93639.1 hypothetical protein SAMN05660284_00023 [Formivibrio citricus]
MKQNTPPSFLAGLLIAASLFMGIPLQSSAAGAAKSPSLARLDADASRLDSDMMALHTRLQDIHKTLWLTKTLLAVPGNLASDLKKLEAELKLLDGMLDTAQAIPQTREDAKKAKQEVDAALKEVSAARAKAEEVEQRVEPFRARLDTADNRIQKVDTNAERFRVAVVHPMPTYTGVAQTCVNYAEQSRMQCMQRTADNKADTLDRGVVQLDEIVRLALTDVPDLVSLKKLEADFEALDSIRNKVEALLKKTHAMLDALKELDGLMGHHFHVSFPYPDPTWKNPARISHYEIKVSMRTILNGSKAIEDEIERTLSKSLWKAAKLFGVGKLVDSLKHQAESELNAIKNKLHLNQSLRIPELARIDGFFGNITADIARFSADFGMNLPDISLDAPSFNYRGQRIDLNAIRNLMNELAPHGISGPAASLCAGVSYGCTASAAPSSRPSAATPVHAPTVTPHTTTNHGTTPSPQPVHTSPKHTEWPFKR